MSNIENITYEQYEPSKILVFDIIGPMAHFRNIQTNSSSISYSFPPPTTSIGIIASILGYKRDTYYDDLAPENIFFSLSILTKFRKIIQTINYRFYEEPGYTQIPVEIIVPKNEDDFYLNYRVYFSIKDLEIYRKLLQRLMKNSSYYPIYMGISEFIAHIRYIGEFEIQKINEKIDTIQIGSVINGIELENMEIPSNGSFFVEIMRRSFKANRIPTKLMKIIYTDAKEIELNNTPETIYRVKMLNEDVYISRIL